MSQQAILAIGIFFVTCGFIISEKIHRTIISMLGGAAIILFGVVNQETALHHIDFNTLGLLIGMMVLVSITAETGVFKFIAIFSAKKVKGKPLSILVSLSLLTAIGSAFLDNVTTVLLMVPVTLSITKQLKINPMPYLLSEILMSNIGGTATMIGDPPNIMIGSAVQSLSFMDFIYNLTPVILIITIITLLILIMIYRKDLKVSDEIRSRIMNLDEKEEITDKVLMIKSLTVVGLTILGFFLHQLLTVESATIALAGAFILLLIAGEKHLEQSLTKVEWPTIFFFIGLFVLVSGLIETGVIEKLSSYAISLTGGNVTSSSILILWLSAIASAFVDNIPFVATMIPLIESMGKMGIHNLEPLWWSLSLGACLGGNGTLIGASANLIVAGLAEKEGYKISFVKFMLLGLPIMLVTITVSMVYIYVRYLI
ncbi:SLC13 family permease [Actinomycetes bacterium NPDC127524]